MLSQDEGAKDSAPVHHEKVLLVHLEPPEIERIDELLSHLDVPMESVILSGIEELGRVAQMGEALLTVFRVDGQRKRPDHDVRLLKRSLPRSIPLLLLIPPGLASKVKQYLRAGGDEFWILPLDSTAFPARFYVLLQWAQSAREEKAGKSWAERAEKWGLRGLRRKIREVGKLVVSRIFHACSDEVPMESTGPLGGKWTEVMRLGGGSFGDVWLVKQKGTEKPAVAKIPHTPKLNLKFMREAAILRHFLGHPNVIRLLDVIQAEGKAVLIQEYVEGRTLQELLEEGLSAARKEKAFLQLLNVVSHAHGHSIMHRDIKPENIIITGSGTLKLLDFGAAKDLSRQSISRTVIGSRPYMAPEQIMGESRLASDVWALGVLLYALATGLLPFYSDNEKELMDSILEQAPEPPRNLEPDLPEGLEEIILKCLERDWTSRYENAGELTEALLERFPHFGTGKVLPQ